MNLSELLSETFLRHSHRPVLDGAAEHPTYAVLGRRVSSVSWQLNAMGCGVGSRAAILSNGSQEYLEVLLSCAQTGVQFCPLSVRLGTDAIRAELNRLKPHVLFMDVETARALGSAEGIPLSAERMIVFGVFRPFVPYSRLTRKHQPYLSPSLIPPETPIVSIFHGGRVTEELTYGTAATILLQKKTLPVETGTVLMCVPYNTLHYILELLVSVAEGKRLVLLKHVSAKNILKYTQQYHVTESLMTPALLQAIAQDAQFFVNDLADIRRLRLGLAYLDLNVIKIIRALFPGDCRLSRPLSFDHPCCKLDIPVSSLECSGDVLHMKVNSVGQPLPGFEIAALDPSGTPLPPENRGLLHLRDTAGSSGWTSLDRYGFTDGDGFVFLDYRSLQPKIEKGSSVAKVLPVGNVTLTDSPDYQIDLKTCDEMLTDFSLASELTDAKLMLRRLSHTILSHEGIDAISIVFPVFAMSKQLNPLTIANELNGTSTTFSVPERFFVRAEDKIQELSTLHPDFPRGVNLLYYPLHTTDGRLLGELYIGLLHREELPPYEKARLHMISRHLTFCLSSFAQRQKSRQMLQLMSTALDLVGDGVGISDITKTPTLIFANNECSRLIGLGKTDPAFGELLERIQTQNMYNLKYGGMDESSASYFYTDEHDCRVWVNYKASRVVAEGEEYAVCINNTRQNSLSIAHLDGLLTRQELAVLEQIIAGATNRQAAECLGISDNTVKYHLSHIYEKLGVKNRAELLAGTVLHAKI